MKTRAKKGFSLCLVLVVLLATNVAIFPMVGQVKASGEASSFAKVYVTPSVYTAASLGEVFTVEVNIANVSNLKGFEFKLGYDTTILDVLEVAEGSFLKGFGTTFPVKLELNETRGYVWVAIILFGTTPAEGDGTLATISFKCTDVSECKFDLYDTMLVDAEAQAIDHYVTDGYSVDELVDPPKQTEIDAAIANGMVWLAAQQSEDGSWGVSDQVAVTGFAVLKFETHAICESMDPLDQGYLYHDQVKKGLDYIFTKALTIYIAVQPAGDPDSDGDDLGVCFSSNGTHHRTYETSIAMMAIAASTHPEMVVNLPGSAVDGWTHKEVLQDTVDYLAFGQNDEGNERGGWGYYENCAGWSDNSNTGYGVFGLAYAEADKIDGKTGFGCTIPSFVKSELDIWIDYIQNDVDGDTNDGGSGYGYSEDWVNILKTGNLLFEMAFVGDTKNTPRVIDAVEYIERHWDDTSSDPGWRGWPGDVAHKQAMYTTMKGFDALGIETIVVDSREVDWFGEMSSVLLEQQNTDGSWDYDYWGDAILGTEWALLTLQKAVPSPPLPSIPYADFTWNPPKPDVNETVTFDASSSTSNTTIIKYEWDFGDGEHGTGRIVTHTYAHSGSYTVTLNVTDSEGLWDIKSKTISVPATCCDFNNDGFVDLLDWGLMVDAFGWTGPPGAIPQDMTGAMGLPDGVVNMRDIAAFALCVVHWETVPPVTEISLDGILGTCGWYVSDVTVTLTATDWLSGIDRTEYSFDEITWIEYLGPFTIFNEGFTTVYYRSIDSAAAHNVEQTKSETIKIDKTAPIITIASPEEKRYRQDETLTIDFEATDAVSGIALVTGFLTADPALIYLDPQTSTAAVDEEFTIDICIADAVDVTLWQVKLKWDPAILNFVSIAEGDFLSSVGPTVIALPMVDQNEGWMVWSVALLPFPDFHGASGSGKLATITLRCIAEGESTLEFTDLIYETFLIDSYGYDIPFEVVNGCFTSYLPEVHDIAVTNVTVPTTKVGSGDTLTITVIVENQGTRPETFDVTAFYDSNIIATQTYISLDAEENATLTFNWNTTGVTLGSYLIRAEATVVPEEVETVDNSFSNGIVMVGLFLYSGETLHLSTFEPGKYTLTVTAIDNACNQGSVSVTFTVVRVIQVEIDIKPDSYPNSININSCGTVPVAVLGSNVFDVSTINPSTIRFADAPALRWSMEDINHDGYMDMVFHFCTEELHISPTSVYATLTGETYDGSYIKGTDTVRIIIVGTGKPLIE